MLPALLLPMLYVFLIAINVIFGLPAIVFFYLQLVAAKSFFANSKPVTQWAAALACLPGMLLSTGGCILLATAAVCNGFETRLEWELSVFGLPAIVGTVVSVCISRKEIHRFIYPDLYADHFKDLSPEDAGMVNT